MPKKKRTSTTPKDETIEQKLIRLASHRVPKAVKAIGQIANLKSYKPTPAQVKAIMNALNSALDNCKSRLDSAPASNSEAWTLPPASTSISLKQQSA